MSKVTREDVLIVGVASVSFWTPFLALCSIYGSYGSAVMTSPCWLAGLAAGLIHRHRTGRNR